MEETGSDIEELQNLDRGPAAVIYKDIHISYIYTYVICISSIKTTCQVLPNADHPIIIKGKIIIPYVPSSESDLEGPDHSTLGGCKLVLAKPDLCLRLGGKGGLLGGGFNPFEKY